MTPLAEVAVRSFRETFGGRAWAPGDEGYEQARSIWNGAIERRPALIACCTSTQDVARAIRFARDSGREISVRGGGHNYSGNALVEGGVTIHLGAMNAVTVDAAARRAACGGGATWGDLDAATQQHGLAVPGGFISHTGIAGLTLGGGIGWLTRAAGLSCDNLLAAEVVTADATVVRASASDDAELLWALRGGGGNFGVVTSFEFALHPVGPMVQLGLFFFGLEDGTRALQFARDYIAGLPDDATSFLGIALSAPPEPFVPEQHRMKTGHALLVVGFGSPEAHAACIAPIRAMGVAPLFELVTPIPFVALQQMFNGSAAWGTFAYEKALYLDRLSDAALAVIAEHAPKKSSPVSFCPTFRLSGAYCARGDDETAFAGRRTPGFVFNIAGHAPTRDLYDRDRAWVRNFWLAMRPHATGPGSYVNFMSESEPERIRASYGDAKYERLARLKARYDPDNVFHLNANILPIAA